VSQAWVATSDGEVVAVAGGKIIGDGVAEVEALYVDVPHQRSGLGRRLIAAAIDHYRGVGISRLDIAVLAANQPAIAFYEHLGGRESGTREDPEGLEIIYSWDLESD
jgi:GNAT superfamily N-acetyltransferase